MSATETLPRDHQIGANNPPLDDAATLAKRLERDGAPLINRAALLEMDCAMLPEAVDTEAKAALVTDAIAKTKALVREVGTFHTEQKAPYLAGGRAVDAFKVELTGPLDKLAETLLARLNAYQMALRAKAAAEQRAREAEERERQRLAREAEIKAAQEAMAAEARIREAAEAMRATKTAEERDVAERAMRDAGAEAIQLRAQAEEQGTIAAEAGRTADAAAKAASGQVGQASRVTAGGASASGSRFWNHRIDAPETLLESLGPWSAWISNDAITAAINAAKRTLGPTGSEPTIKLPGVTFFEDFRTTVTASRRR